MNVKRTKINPPHFTKYDTIIKKYLDDPKHTMLVECPNRNAAEAMSKALYRRIKTQKLPNISSHLWESNCYISCIDKESVRQRYEEINKIKTEMHNLSREKAKANIRRAQKTHGEMVRKERAQSIIVNTVNCVCYDFTKLDQAFLTSEIIDKIENISVNMKGRSYTLMTSAFIYLLSKCPANSDKPLQYREVYRRYLATGEGLSEAAFFDAISILRNAGVETCRITPQMIINSHKDDLIAMGGQFGISQIDMGGMIDLAIAVVNDPKLKWDLAGRNPFALAAAAVYMSRGELPVTQDMISGVFNITEVSIRNITRRIKEIRGEIEPRKK